MGTLMDDLFSRAAALPYPIAVRLRAAQVAQHAPSTQYDELVGAAEALMQLVGSVALLDTVAEGQAGKVLSSSRPLQASTGLWRRCIEQRLAGLRTPTLPALTALANARDQRECWHTVQAHLAELVTARNKHAHPSRHTSAVEAHEHRPGLVRALLGFLEGLDWLGTMVMVVVGKHDDLAGKVWLRPLMGPEQLRSSIAVDWQQAPPEGRVVVMDLKAGRWLALNPLYRWVGDRLCVWARGEKGSLQWFVAHEAGRVVTEQRPEAETWLPRRLSRAGAVRRGAFDLAPADLDTLAGVHRTRAHEISGAVALDALASPTLPELEVVASRRAGLPLAALAGAALAAIGVYAVLSGSGNPDPAVDQGAATAAVSPSVAPAPKPAEPAPSAPATRPAVAAVVGSRPAIRFRPKLKRRVVPPLKVATPPVKSPTVRIVGARRVPSVRDPRAVIKAIAAHREAGELPQYFEHFAPELACAPWGWDVAPDTAQARQALRRRFGQLEARTVAKSGGEALVQEDYWEGQPGSPGRVRWWKLRVQGQHWAVVAQGKPHRGGPAPCTKRMAAYFNQPVPQPAPRLKLKSLKP